MRITMFSHGTRGDIWPLVSLGAALQLRDHEVTFAVQDEYRPLAESAGLRTAPRDCAPTANAYRVKLGLAESSTSTFNRLQTGTALGLHTISPQLFPRPTDWPEHLKMTGARQMPEAIRSAAGEQLDQELLDWLDAGAAPVFLGFGSMPCR